MPLPSGGVESVARSSQGPGYPPLYFQFEEYVLAIVISRLGPEGVIAAVPEGGIPEASLDAARDSAYEGLLGPSAAHSVFARQARTLSRASRSRLDIRIIELGGLDAISEALSPAADVDAAAAIQFGRLGAAALWPHAAGLEAEVDAFLQSAAAPSLEEYATAAEGSGPGQADDAVLAIADGAQGGRLEELLSSTLSRLEAIEQRLGPAPLPPPGLAAAAPAAPGAFGGAAAAPQLFHEADAVGLSAEQATRLAQLAGRGPARLGDPAPRHSIGSLAAGAAAADAALVEAAGEGQEEEAADLSVNNQLLLELVRGQNKVFEKLLKGKAEDPMSLLANADLAEDSKVQGARGLAARQMVIDWMEKHPSAVYQMVRRNLAQALRVEEVLPGDMLRYFETRVPFGQFKCLSYFGTLLACMWEAAENQRYDDVKSILARGLVFTEQVATEGGNSYHLGRSLTGLQEPNWGLLQSLKHAPAGPYGHVHARLADPRWVSASLAHFRDLDLMNQRSKQIAGAPASGSGGSGAQPDPPPRPPRKGKPGKGSPAVE